MKTVIAHLNAVVEDRMPTALKPEAARQALFAIETTEMAVTALRLVLDHLPSKGHHPQLAEAVAHGRRYLDLHAVQMKRQAAKLAEDVSDLV